MGIEKGRGNGSREEGLCERYNGQKGNTEEQNNVLLIIKVHRDTAGP